MTKESRMANDGKALLVIRASSFLRHSSLVIRHSPSRLRRRLRPASAMRFSFREGFYSRFQVLDGFVVAGGFGDFDGGLDGLERFVALAGFGLGGGESIEIIGAATRGKF